MTLLLDTQAFLWFVTDDSRLSAAARDAIEYPANDRALSIASVWEMAIKYSLGKLKLADPFLDFIRKETAGNQIVVASYQH